MAARKKKAVPPSHAAAALARQGKWEEALGQLTALSDGGDGVAAASTTELLAALGRWEELVPHAARFLENPGVVNIGNVFTEVTRLVRRAARELDDASIIERVAAKIPDEGHWRSMRDATLLKEVVLPSEQAGPERGEHFDKAVKDALTAKRFKNKPPAVLDEHCFALADVFRVDDEVISRYDPGWRNFDKAVVTARANARRGNADQAWAILAQAIPWWAALDFAQVFPVGLLVDPTLQRLMTKERGVEVLATPRSEFA